MGEDDTSTTTADGKPIRVSGQLKKSYFAETVQDNNKDSGSNSNKKSGNKSSK